MKLMIPRYELKEAMQGLNRVIARNATLPILKAVRFSAKNGQLTATATDLEQTGIFRFETPAADNVQFLVDSKHLLPLLKGRDNDVVEFEILGKNQLGITNTVAGHGITTTAELMDIAEWPADPPEIKSQTVDGSFMAHLRSAMRFASTDESRYVLNSVYLEAGAKDHHLVATDGRRLTCFNSATLPINEGCIVPVRKFLSWNKLEGPVAIGTRKMNDVTWFGLEMGRWSYVTKCLEGAFPNWRQVVPSEPGKHRMTFGDEDVQLLRNVLPTFPGFDRADGLIKIAGHKGKLVISGNPAESEAWTDLHLEHSTHTGPDSSVGVSRDYLTDALEAGFRTFSYADEHGPLLSTTADGGTHVLMPIRLSETPAPQPVTHPAVAPQTVRQVQPRQTKHHQEGAKVMRDEKKKDSALDRVLAAFEIAKLKVREANDALVAIANAVKEAVREDRQRQSEVDAVRAGLAKVQAIRV